MPTRLRVRDLSAEEESQLRSIAASRSFSSSLVQRARLIVLMLDNPGLAACEAGYQVGFKTQHSGRSWVKRFNAEGISGLSDRARAGRPIIHTQAVRSALIDLALHKPEKLGYPFALWTLERLQRAFKERQGVHLSDSTIWEWLHAEGLVWKKQQSWFDKVKRNDPDFVEKRGP